ncbi:hypothetical protein [Streptomyces sp. NPDC058674]
MNGDGPGASARHQRAIRAAIDEAGDRPGRHAVRDVVICRSAA